MPETAALVCASANSARVQVSVPRAAGDPALHAMSFTTARFACSLLGMSQIAPNSLPPGPRLPAWVQLILFMRYCPRFVAACGRRYGKVFTIRAATVPPMVYLAD